MSRFVRWVALLIALAGGSAFAQTGAMAGFCDQGGTKAQVSGLPSTNYLQGVIPSCTVSVYVTGTGTLATLYANPTGTPLSNPFTANTASSGSPGHWIFWAAQVQNYDVVGSAGIAPNVYVNPVTLRTDASVSGPYLPTSGGVISGAITAPEINGVVYPAQCGSSAPASWCTGTTADAWIRAACAQLPTQGGVVDLVGLNGNLAATTRGCSTATKNVAILTDQTSKLTITETDGDLTFPLANGSILVGRGAGQCVFGKGGIYLSSGANVKGIVGPANVDGTQENLDVEGNCLFGATGATVSGGIMYGKSVFVNTTFAKNNVSECNKACLWLEDMGGMIVVENNEFNVTDGNNSIVGSGIVLAATADTGSGCLNQTIKLSNNNAEHANGGINYPDLKVGGGANGGLICNLYVDGLYTERNAAGGTPVVNSIDVTDCWTCSFRNVNGAGTATGNAFIYVHQDTLPDGTGLFTTLQNLTFDGIGGNQSYTYLLQDTSPPTTPPVYPWPSGGKTFATGEFSTITHYASNPGYESLPPLPASTINSFGVDLMNGDGLFNAGSSTFGTNFGATGCVSGVSCVYSRSNATAPPGLTFSQEVTITANTDPSGGDNGIIYSPGVSFVAGQGYQVSFWAKASGGFAGVPTFFLGDPTIPTQYCTNSTQAPFPTTWTAYTLTCIPTTSGTSKLQLVSSDMVGDTGSFWFAGFTFAPLAPLAAGALLESLSPYGIGPATAALQTITINSQACQLAGSCTVTAGLTGTTGTITGTSLSGTCDSGTATASGAVVGHPVSVSSTTGADVGAAFNLRASVTSTNTVTVYVCGTGTPASLAYNVTVF